MKLLRILLLSSLFLTACSTRPIDIGHTCIGCALVCVEGVRYLLTHDGITVMYNTDGTIKKCGE